jgi:hypothetical protein
MTQELNQLMLEMEERLEIALDNLEYHASFISQDDIDVIRAACGKPRNSQVNPLLRDVINDFGNCFGNPLASFPSIRGDK